MKNAPAAAAGTKHITVKKPHSPQAKKPIKRPLEPKKPSSDNGDSVIGGSDKDPSSESKTSKDDKAVYEW